VAQVTKVVLIDDVDGGDATETIHFALDGVQYEIDLNDDNAARLRESLGEWAEKARKTSRAGTAPRKGKAAGTQSAKSRGYDTKAVREWAESKGIDVPARGRIRAEVVEQYLAQAG
jgi:uncharacterized membrane protein